MAIRHVIVSVGETATPVAGEGGSALVSTSEDDVFVGGAGVTAESYGYKLTSALPLAIDLGPGEVLYAVAESETDVHVLLTGV